MDYVGHTPYYASDVFSFVDEDPASDETDSWVMLDRDGGIVPLSKERILYKQQSRISLTLSTPTELKNAPAFCVKSDAGTVYITTFRVWHSLTSLWLLSRSAFVNGFIHDQKGRRWRPETA